MKTEDLKCPCCGAVIDIDIRGRTNIFCSYCGRQIFLDDEKQEFTYNKNINVKKTVNNIFTDEAEVIRAKSEGQKDKREMVWFAVIMGTLFLMVVLSLTVPAVIKANNERLGKISAGNYSDLVGEDYRTVEAHFRAAGFTNIELIDLDDSGIAFWNNGKVKTISVGGNTSFSTFDYFDSDVKIVISYY